MVKFSIRKISLIYSWIKYKNVHLGIYKTHTYIKIQNLWFLPVTLPLSNELLTHFECKTGDITKCTLLKVDIISYISFGHKMPAYKLDIKLALKIFWYSALEVCTAKNIQSLVNILGGKSKFKQTWKKIKFAARSLHAKLIFYKT